VSWTCILTSFIHHHLALLTVTSNGIGNKGCEDQGTPTQLFANNGSCVIASSYAHQQQSILWTWVLLFQLSISSGSLPPHKVKSNIANHGLNCWMASGFCSNWAFFASNRNFIHHLCQWIRTPKVGGEQFPYDHSVSGMPPEDMNHENSN
jgi:hypothetical protein